MEIGCINSLQEEAVIVGSGSTTESLVIAVITSRNHQSLVSGGKVIQE